MALKIRLRRMGRKGAPTYRVVVAETTMPRDGRFVASIGHYNPRTEPITLVIDRDKALYWLSKGALPTDTARSLLKKAGVFGPAPAVTETPAAPATPAGPRAAIKDAAAKVRAAASKAGAAASAAASEVVEDAREAIEEAVEDVKEAVEEVVEEVREKVEDVVEEVREAIEERRGTNDGGQTDETATATGDTDEAADRDAPAAE